MSGPPVDQQFVDREPESPMHDEEDSKEQVLLPEEAPTTAHELTGILKFCHSNRANRFKTPLPSHRQIAANAFKTGYIVRWNESTVLALKGVYRQKLTVFDSLGDPTDVGTLLNNGPGSITTPSQFCGIANWRVRYMLKNWSAYHINARISWWTCRQKVVASPAAPTITTLSQFYDYGFTNMGVPFSGYQVTSTQPTSSPFTNRMWCTHFKCTRMKRFRLAPYRSRAIHHRHEKMICADYYMNTGNDAGSGSQVPLAVSHQAGLTTKVIMFEFLGDMNPDNTAWPNTEFVHTPVLFSIETQEFVDVGFPTGGISQMASASAAEPTVTQLSSMNPFTWNGGVISSSVGTAPMGSALTSGL